ncbi:MAG: GNAT family protein [Chitinophagaceae bacterium]
MSFPELISHRYRLRQILPQDLEFIFHGLSHPQVIPFYGVRYETPEATVAQMNWYDELWRDRTGIWWIVMDEAQQPLGACGFNYYHPQHEKIELGFWLLPEHWSKGIMKEVLPVIIAYIFSSWKVHRIEALVETGNLSSSGLLIKLGFKQEGILRESEIKEGKRISLVMFSKLITD